MIKQARTPKTVQVLATYTFKQHAARVCFSVKSSSSASTYTTCFDHGHGSCSCDGASKFHKVCYHITELAPRAASIIAGRQAQVRAAYTALYDPCEVA